MKKQTKIPVKMIVTHIFRNVNTFFDKKTKTDKIISQMRKYFFKNVLTFSKSGVIIKTRKSRRNTEDCKMNAYNSYACKGNVTAARKRQTSVLLRPLRAVFLTEEQRPSGRNSHCILIIRESDGFWTAPFSEPEPAKASLKYIFS